MRRTKGHVRRMTRAGGGTYLCLLVSACVLWPSLLPREVHAQPDVVDALLRQRLEVRLAEVAAAIGEEAPPRPPAPVPVPLDFYLVSFEASLAAARAQADSLARARADSAAAAVQLGPIRWRAVAAHEQGGFLAAYREVFWGAVNAPSAMDTVATPELRARLATLFGAPTRNAAAAEQEGYAGSEHVQFEYWLVANDSIPILVLDVDGPFGRGLLVAGDDHFRQVLPALKDDLAARVIAAGPPAAYADYYHSQDRRAWYRTGYDGRVYFTEEVRQPRWAREARPGLRWRIYR